MKAVGVPRGLIGYVVDDPGIARQGDALVDEHGAVIGVTTSGTKTPTVNRAIGLAIVPTRYTAVDTKLGVMVRDRRLACHVVKRPFYKRAS
jgi:aminomethyltransferase